MRNAHVLLWWAERLAEARGRGRPGSLRALPAPASRREPAMQSRGRGRTHLEQAVVLARAGQVVGGAAGGLVAAQRRALLAAHAAADHAAAPHAVAQPVQPARTQPAAQVARRESSPWRSKKRL